jgi:hypothetical protein
MTDFNMNYLIIAIPLVLFLGFIFPDVRRALKELFGKEE